MRPLFKHNIGLLTSTSQAWGSVGGFYNPVTSGLGRIHGIGCICAHAADGVGATRKSDDSKNSGNWYNA